jgi:hypothetical protein
MSDLKNLIGDIVASPLGQVIAQVGQGVADAQEALDEGSLARVLEIYSEGDDEKLALLREIGYRPTFYALPETTGEVRVALRLGNGALGAGQARPVKPTLPTAPTVRAVPARAGLSALAARMYASPVDAGYANAYGYQADIAAKLTFKIMPVPPPDGADELRRVPDLAGRSATQASAALEALGLVAVFIDADGQPVDAPGDTFEVASQIPAAAAVVRMDDEISLTLAASA